MTRNFPRWTRQTTVTSRRICFRENFQYDAYLPDLIMHNYPSNQSALLTRCGTDSHHQYGIFGGTSQTSFSRNATRAGSEEGRLFSQANIKHSNQCFKTSRLGKSTPLRVVFSTHLSVFRNEVTSFSCSNILLLQYITGFGREKIKLNIIQIIAQTTLSRTCEMCKRDSQS